MGGRTVPEFPNNAKAITPGAAQLTDNDGEPVSMSVFVGVAGDVVVRPVGHGSSGPLVTFTAAAGSVLPVRVNYVTSATATGLVGVW